MFRSIFLVCGSFLLFATVDGTSNRTNGYKYIVLQELILPDKLTKTVPHFHPLTGCKFTSQFVDFGKKSLFKIYVKHSELLNNLGRVEFSATILRAEIGQFTLKLFTTTEKPPSLNQLRRILATTITASGVHPLISQIVKTVCNYNIEEEPSVYSIKFTKNGEEYYRYFPTNINIDLISTELHLELTERKGNGLESDGIYHCNVTNLKKSIINKSEPESDMAVEIVVEPSEASVGQTVKILCNYDIENDILYSIKLYTDFSEFYRYSPQDSPREKVFPQPYLEVWDMERNSVQFRLKDLKAAGNYTCEVITLPSFRTKKATKKITIQSSSQENSNKVVTEKSPFIQVMITPNPPVIGKSIKLEWSYDTEGEEVYTFKIYKNQQEFYRYVPCEVPSIKLFPVPDIQVDASSMSNSSLELISVTQKTSDVYRFEVQTEAPFFRTIRTEASIQVRNSSLPFIRFG